MCLCVHVHVCMRVCVGEWGCVFVCVCVCKYFRSSNKISTLAIWTRPRMKRGIGIGNGMGMGEICTCPYSSLYPIDLIFVKMRTSLNNIHGMSLLVISTWSCLLNFLCGVFLYFYLILLVYIWYFDFCSYMDLIFKPLMLYALGFITSFAFLLSLACLILFYSCFYFYYFFCVSIIFNMFNFISLVSIFGIDCISGGLPPYYVPIEWERGEAT